MDDPGWGDHVPVPGNDKPAPTRGPGKRGGGMLQSGIGGPWVVGALVLAVIIGVGAYLKFSSSSPKKAATTVTTTIAATTTATTTTPTTTTKPKPKPKPKPKQPSIKAYSKKADVICTKYNAKMAVANNDSDLPAFLKYLRAEWLAVAKLPHPATGASEMRKAIKDAGKGIAYLSKNNDHPTSAQVAAANNFLLSAHTIEGVLGMKVCNFNH